MLQLKVGDMRKIISLLAIMMLVACEKQPTPMSESTQGTKNLEKSLPIASSTPSQTNILKIDWQKIASNEPAIDPKNFKYPFELDSEAVKMYAKEYNIDNQSARYQMTVGMALNEVLSKLLDQLGTTYTSHEIIIDKTDNMPVLRVHTTANVANLQENYVFADKFAKGLTMKVQVINDGVKQPIKNPHSDE